MTTQARRRGTRFAAAALRGLLPLVGVPAAGPAGAAIRTPAETSVPVPSPATSSSSASSPWPWPSFSSSSSSSSSSSMPTDDVMPARITLTTLEPLAPRPGSRLLVRGTVRNTGPELLRAVRVRLVASRLAVGTRSQLAEQALGTAPFGFLVEEPSAAADLPDLRPGEVTHFALRAGVTGLQLPGLGVYPFGVEVRGDRQEGTATVGRLRTWLPYTTPTDHARPTRLAWVWPLADAPDRNPDGSFPSDRVAAEVSRHGRLAALLQAARDARTPRPARGVSAVPVTYAVDPALLETLAAMADGYSVRPPGGAGRPGAGQRQAAAYLAQLRRLTALDPVLALPYGDPDVVALVRAVRAGDVSRATGAPTFLQLVESVLGVPPLDHLAWPPDGLVTRPTLDALPGIDTLVLSGAALPAPASLTYTPDAAAVLPALAGGTLRALVSDPTLDAIVAAGPADSADLRVAEQRFLAETLLITAERPALSRHIVVTPPRRWAPAAAWAKVLLGDSGRVPWLRPVALTAIPGPLAQAPARGALSYPDEARRDELPRNVLRGPGSVGELTDQLTTFRSILTDPEQAGVPALERVLLGAASTAWRDDPAAGRRLRLTAAKTVHGLASKVRITSGGEVALASRASTIAVSVANGLSQPVRVQLALRSNEAQLVARDTEVRRIDGGHQIQLEVRVRATSAGVFPVFASLRTPEGKPYGAPVKLLVHSTRYGALAIGITAGAFAVLVLAAAVRLTRRLKAARRARPAGTP